SQYSPITTTYTVTPSAGANGSITPNTAQVVYSGGSVDFTAAPAAGYTVSQWLVNGSVQIGATGDTYTVSNITANTAVRVTFTPQNGSLQVNTAPAGAASAGAQWRVDGGAWQDSGTVISSLSVGSHAVTFKTINDW